MNYGKLPFQVEIYKALQENREVAVLKSVQNGISETFIVSHLEEAYNGLTILYVLPKTQTRNTFVQNRVNKVIKQIPFYQQQIKNAPTSADSVVLKFFGNKGGVMKYVDSNSASNFVELPADALYIDEEDMCNQKNLAMAPDRLESSEYKYIRRVGNPSIEGFGIDIAFKAGSQNWWNNRCEHCGKYQILDWYENVVREIDKGVFDLLDMRYDLYNLADEPGSVNIYCKHCHKPMDRLSTDAQWVEKYKREKESFQISKLFTPFTSIRELSTKFAKATENATELQIFHNSDLGLPYSASGAKVTWDMINSSRVNQYFCPEINLDGLVWAGVDVGSMNNIVVRKMVNGKKRALYIGTSRDEGEIIRVIRDYGVKCLVIDSLPETRMVERLKNECDIIYSCTFSQVVQPSVDKKKKKVSVKRTAMLDRIVETFAKDEYENPINIKDVKDYYDQMCSSTRILDKERNPPDYVWREVGADHYFLTEGYAEIALEIARSKIDFSYLDDIVSPEVKDEGQPMHELAKKTDDSAGVLNKIFNRNMFGGRGD